MPPDSRNALLPFAFVRLPVRGAVVQLDSEWRALAARQDHPLELSEILGEAAAAAPLIVQGVKDGASITLQLSGGDALSLLVMQCNHALDFRGLASARRDVDGLAFAELTAGARCAITIDTPGNERPYQGIVEVDRRSLATSLEGYFQRSAQLPSHLALVADSNRCGGVLLQQMPGRGELGDDDWMRLGVLCNTLALPDLDSGAGPSLLGRLFAADDLRLFPARPARFRCRCSRARAANALKLLGRDECELSEADRERIVVTCEYCGSRERFDPVDIAALFAAGPPPASDRIH